MVVEDRLVAALERRVGRALHVGREQPPARVVEPQRGVLAAAPRVRDALGPARVAQHRPRAVGAGGVEQVERVVQRGRVLVVAVGVREPHRHEAADELEARGLEALAQHLALPEVAGRAEVGAGVAGGADRLEHPLGIGDREVGPDGHLERAVAERGVGDLDHRAASQAPLAAERSIASSTRAQASISSTPGSPCSPSRTAARNVRASSTRRSS